MEVVLDTYKYPYDPLYPLLCMDESPKQLIAETRLPVPPKPGKLARYDYEYSRKGGMQHLHSDRAVDGQAYRQGDTKAHQAGLGKIPCRY